MEEEYPKTRGISRLDYEHTSEGWWARYTRDGVVLSQVFRDNDPKYGSKKAAWEAAVLWHKEAREIFPPINRKEYAQIKKGNNKSGHTGVHRSFSRRVSGKRYYWAAHWAPEKDKQQHAFFYVDEHGEEGAKQLAINKRKEEVSKIREGWPEEYWEFRRRDEDINNTFFFDVFAYEGDSKYEIHKRYERSREIRKLKLEAFLEAHGALFCEVCGFNYEREYGEIGKGLIEVHHTVAVSEMEEAHQTKLEELICICSNCHFAVHNGDHVENLRKLMFVYDARSSKS